MLKNVKNQYIIIIFRNVLESSDQMEESPNLAHFLYLLILAVLLQIQDVELDGRAPCNSMESSYLPHSLIKDIYEVY